MRQDKQAVVPGREWVRMTSIDLLWKPVEGYIDTASYGLPSIGTMQAVEQALSEWQSGLGVWEQWSTSTESARASFAKLVNTESSSVTIGAASSQLIGMIASSLPRKAVVVVPDIEFTSNLFPWMVAEDHGVVVRAVPLEYLNETVAQGCDLVATSAVQSATGEVVELTSLRNAAESVGALTVVDATQAAGWYPIDASQHDAVVCSGYKWLCSPRGVAYMTLSERLAAMLEPSAAGWYAGEVIKDSYYGPPLRLAKDGRRFDISPAWFSWVGGAAANNDLLTIGIEEIYRHNVYLANRLLVELDMQPTDSAIVSLKINSSVDPAKVPFRASLRGGGLRISFHIYNDENDLDRAASFLKGSIVRS